MSEFSKLVELMNQKEKSMSKSMKTKSPKGGSKNPAIKSGNPAFKPTNNVGSKVTGAKGKLNNSMWRGTGRGK